MSFRTRLTLVATGAVAASLVLASIIVYVAVAASTRSQVDDGLRRQVLLLARPAPGSTDLIQGDGQVVTADGQVTPLRPDSLTLPFVTEARGIAAGRGGTVFRDVHVLGSHLRVLIGPLGPGRAVELGAPLDRVDQLLHRLAVVLMIVTAAGVIVAAVAGRLVAQAALGPVLRLRGAARGVAAARRPGARVPVEGDDELADLATSFNDMITALERSLAAQRALVADASHELRTPLTSLGTNIEFLRREPGMEAHAPLLGELRDETADLGALVSDLIELARHEGDEEPGVDVRLDELTATAVARAQRRAPELTFVTDLHPVTVSGVAGRLDRAITNVIDNAVKWSPPQGAVEISVAAGELVVRDHGPGIAAADLPNVFNRFYRSGDAHQLPGSGLGLAIVRQVADAHGGTVTAERPPDGGTRIRLWFPESPAPGT
ncbi:MAG: two-component system, OmpR family, sensor histidine kinase MprB [Acidimicrobiaceae bacterium]